MKIEDIKIGFYHMPRFAGSTVTLTGEAEEMEYLGNVWYACATKEGSPISASAILRNGNGLSWPNNWTPNDVLSACKDCTLIVQEIKSIGGRTYVIFEPHVFTAKPKSK